MITVAALYVDPRGTYAGLGGVELWDEQRDARTYPGPHPVVAHPPCGRWVMPLAKVNETRYGHRVGDDGGCFELALRDVRAHGGLLEHPSTSSAFRHFGLPKPIGRAWIRTFCGGWVCEVSQCPYGHPAKKLTLLYMVGADPPPMLWGDGTPTAIISWLPNTTSTLPRLTKRKASATPPAFRDQLLAIARSARPAPKGG